MTEPVIHWRKERMNVHATVHQAAKDHDMDDKELIADGLSELIRVSQTRSVTMGLTRQGTYFVNGILPDGKNYFASGRTLLEMIANGRREMKDKQRAD